MAGARYDILELGGGGASSTVISPRIFDEFVAPYDSQLIEVAHRAGQRIAYHTCGGMMPILENIAAMKPNAMETFTPPGMGGDIEPGRGPAADSAEHLHDRRLRPVPFLQGLHRRADAGRGPPLLPGGRPQRRLHPLPLRQLLRGRAGTDQGLRRRGEEMRVLNAETLPLCQPFSRRTCSPRGGRNMATSIAVFALSAVVGWALIVTTAARADDGPDPIFEKPAAISMAELAKRSTDGVSALEVSDYAPGHYTGKLSPSPPHADMNPRKAVVVFWKDRAERFVFSHEASYCPILELPSGAAMCNQFFEGNMGNAELFNSMGRKEKNSFVDIVQSGPRRVWVRWNYSAVNMTDDSQPRLRGTGGLHCLSQRTGLAAGDV